MTGLLEIHSAEYLAIETPGAAQVVELPVEVVELVEIPEQGPAGPPGATGAQGPQGNPGLSGANYVHQQMVPSATWVIAHGLNRYPSITIVDSAGSVVIGAVDYDSTNQITVTFSAAFGGSAYLN